MMNLNTSKLLISINYEFYLKSRTNNKVLKKQLNTYIKSNIALYDNTYKTNDVVKDGMYMVINKNIDGYKTMIKTPFLSTVKSKNRMNNILAFIKAKGYTDWRCNCTIELYYDNVVYAQDYLTKIIPIKFAMMFDEEYIWKLFPRRRFSPFYLSLKRIRPMFIEKTVNITHTQFSFLRRNDLYVDFSKRLNNKICINYIGGEGYQNNPHNITLVINHFSDELERILKTATIPIDIQKNYKQRLVIVKNLVESANKLDSFTKRFPNVKLFYDLKNYDEKIRTFLDLFGTMLGWKLLETNVRSGVINFDSEIDRLQFKYLDVKKGGLFKNDDILNSTLNKTILENCYIRDCTLVNCTLINCIVENTKITDSKISSTTTNKNTILTGCHLTNKTILDNSTVKSCYLEQVQLFNYQINSKKVDKNTTIIQLLDNESEPTYR